MRIMDNDLYQFSTHIPQINLSFHQYLLYAKEPLLVHTGNVNQAQGMLSKLKEALNGIDLKYIFVSHFEADECGGLPVILEQFQNAKVICSEVTARQLSGFGIECEVIIKKEGEKLTTDDYELEFFNYPSEMHLWDGLLVMENRRQIFFSSDLMLRYGEEIGTIKEADWNEEIDSIQPVQVPDNDKREKLKMCLIKLNPIFVATGHGPCLKIK
ncbi:MBL fold metallo-hydrolase [Clostridium saccharobutylicum]|uniref:Nitric oxide reductase n=1 Tax=Clostridium saccharobutylicum TaxID=169679 RepID=A0A1S8NHY8_CLOSA|nr:MBL fold metallo-hydrolase [Clostridium saccharobutylicum]OOM16095.1 nitric oxide reductase [Clostridium saccharobutylicum]